MNKRFPDLLYIRNSLSYGGNLRGTFAFPDFDGLQTRENLPTLSTYLMSYLTNNDNIYKIGSTVFAKSRPDVALVIMRYYHRTYFCVTVSNPLGKQYEYFEKDLYSPRRKAA